jgi:hypothetical protein
MGIRAGEVPHHHIRSQFAQMRALLFGGLSFPLQAVALTAN